MAASNSSLSGNPAAMYSNREPSNPHGGVQQPRTPEPSQSETSTSSIEQITALISLVRQREAGVPLDSTIKDLINILHRDTPCSPRDRERVEEISDSLNSAISNRKYTCPVCAKNWSGKKARNELVNRHIKSYKGKPIISSSDMLHHELYVKYFGLETVCSFCREHFKTLPVFVKHMLQYHAIDPLDELIPPSEPGIYYLWDKNTVTDVLIGPPPLQDVTVRPWQDVVLNIEK